MATEKKKKTVEEIQGIFSRCSIGIVTDYRGLKTTESNEIRRKLREIHAEYHVVKNSLARIAARNAGLDYVVGTLTGPVALAIGYDEAPAPAKVLADHIRTSKSNLAIKGGFLPDKALSTSDIENLARLPSREILLAQVLSGIQSPIYGLVNVLAAPLREVMGVLQARIKQLEAN